MSRDARATTPVALAKMPGVHATEADWEAYRFARRAEIEAEHLAHPCGYKGPLRTATGQRGNGQWGGYFDQGQATEMHRVPFLYEDGRRWRYGNEWHWAVGVLALNDGSWLAWSASSIRPPHGWTRDRGSLLPFGGFFTHSRRFCTRDHALRANIAYVIRQARRQHRWKPKPDASAFERRNPWPGGDMPAEDAQKIIAWAMDVAGRPAPALFVVLAAPPPIVKVQPDKRGQWMLAI